jgi:hypothetical protein
MASEKTKYLQGMLEAKSTEDLQRILQAHGGYSKETILIVRQILRRRGELSQGAEKSHGSVNLVSCPDCGKHVSRRAEKCPNCGASVKKILEWKSIWSSIRSIPRWAWVTFGVILALLILISAVQENQRRKTEMERQQILKQQAEAREQKAREERAKQQIEREARVQESMSYANEALYRWVLESRMISGFWSQRGSAWIQVPANWANNKPVCREYAERSANFLRSTLGYVVCVHLYYGDQNEIASACR